MLSLLRYHFGLNLTKTHPLTCPGHFSLTVIWRLIFLCAHDDDDNRKKQGTLFAFVLPRTHFSSPHDGDERVEEAGGSTQALSYWWQWLRLLVGWFPPDYLLAPAGENQQRAMRLMLIRPIIAQLTLLNIHCLNWNIVGEFYVKKNIICQSNLYLYL